MSDSWELLDAEEHAAAHPRSFFIPARALRENLEPGDLVKLVFRPVGEDAGERMWVEVTDRAPGGFVGVLGNDPLVIQDLQEGARVEFESRHVIDIWDDEPDPYADLAAFASARLLDDDEAEVGALTYDSEDAGRELGDGRRLSGWSFFEGAETAEELEDPERIRLPSIGWLLQRYPDVEPVVSAHDGAAAGYERTPEGFTRTGAP